MQRNTLIAFALVVAFSVGWLLHSAQPQGQAPLADGGPSPVISDAGVDGDAATDADAQGEQADASSLDEFESYIDWSLYPDGAPVPDLPPTAPQAVRFGAFLVPYEGAEYAPKDAPPRAEAEARARQLLLLARRDFEEAAEEAHAGGSDLGLMRRGILEPALEYTLFSLKPGEICSQPVDSPRGFWVLQRLK